MEKEGRERAHGFSGHFRMVVVAVSLNAEKFGFLINSQESGAIMATKPHVILTRKLPDSVETRMRELFSAELNSSDTPFSREQLKEAVGRADVLVPTVTDRIDQEIIKAAGPGLKLIASFGTGVDHIDLKAAREAGITVTNTPGVLTEDTADVALALILSVPGGLPKATQSSGKETGQAGRPPACSATGSTAKTRDYRDGPDWPGHCTPGTWLRHVDPLSQSPPGSC